MKNQRFGYEGNGYCKHYYYNANGENTSVIEHAPDESVIKTTTMTYDDFGRMLTWTDGNSATSYSYRGAGWERASETTGGTTTQFLYDNNDIVGDLVSGSFTRQYVTPFLDENLSMTVIGGEQAGTYYYHKDATSVRGLTNSSQVVVNVNAYSAFGEPYTPGTTIGVAQRYTFQGREASAVGAPMGFRNRAYFSTLGRFGRRDPESLNPAAGASSEIERDALRNLYVGMRDNPVSRTDAMGLWSTDTHLTATRSWLWLMAVKVRGETWALTEGNASAVAEADEATDYGATAPRPWGDYSYHMPMKHAAFPAFPPPDGPIVTPDPRIQHSEEHLAKAVKMTKEKWEKTLPVGDCTKDCQKIMEQLGRGLHPLQDTLAHTAKHHADTPYKHVSGPNSCHWPKGTKPAPWECENNHKPDSKDLWAEDWLATRVLTENYIAKYIALADVPCNPCLRKVK